MCKLRRQKGVTLVELMIAVAIAGILVAIGYPSYQNYLASAARGSVQADLMAFATAMERHSASTFSYAGAASGGSDTGSPAIFASHSPASEPVGNKKYNLTISEVGAGGNTFIIEAAPVSGTVVAGTGSLFYYSDGRKAWDKDASGSIATSEFCWAC